MPTFEGSLVIALQPNGDYTVEAGQDLLVVAASVDEIVNAASVGSSEGALVALSHDPIESIGSPVARISGGRAKGTI